MPVARADVVEGILGGIALANRRFENWSKGAWIPDYGIEGFMVAQIAESLRKKQSESESLLIEVPFSEIEEFSNASRRPGRRQNVLQGRRRADIALFDRQYRSVYVIEAKRMWTRRTCFRDIERILALLNTCARQRNGTLRAGFLCLPIAEWGHGKKEVKEKISKKIRRIEDDVRSHFEIGRRRMELKNGRIQWYPEEYSDGEDWGTSAICMTFLP